MIDIIKKCSDFKSEFEYLQKELYNKETVLSDAEIRILENNKLIADREIAITVVKKMLETANLNTVNLFSEFITDGLRSIFYNENYKITFKLKDRGKYKIVEILFDDGLTPDIPINEIGGGVQVVIAFLLQVVLLKIFKKRMFILLDESLIQVSKEYIPTLMSFIKSMSTEYGLTILLITHNDLSEYADKSYKMEKGVATLMYSDPDLDPNGTKIKVNIKNFQIIAQTSIEIQGVTLLTGPTNNGKSALLKACIYALRNEQGSHYIKYGEDTCKTALKFENFVDNDDILLKWSKTKTGGEVEIKYQGKTTHLEKLGRGQDSIIAIYKPFNLDGVKLGDLYLTPNFWMQMEKPVTTELSGKSDMFKLFNWLSGSGKILDITESLNRDLTELVEDQKELNIKSNILNGDIGRIKQSIECMEETCHAIEELLPDYIKNKDIRDELINLGDYNNNILKSEVKYRNIKLIIEHLNSISNLSDILLSSVVLADSTNSKIDCEDKVKNIDMDISIMNELSTISDKLITINNLSLKTNSKDILDVKIRNIINVISSLSDLNCNIEMYSNVSVYNISNGDKINLLNSIDSIDLQISIISKLISNSDILLESVKLDNLINSKQETMSNSETIIGELSEIDVCPTCLQSAHFHQELKNV